MTMGKKLLGYAAGLGLGCALASGANAAIFTESGDASNLLSGAQVVGSGINQINGSIDLNDLGDLYRVTFATGGTLTINGNITGGFIDPVAFLFVASGAGIAFNVDCGGPNSTITVNIAAGTYYVGIGDFPMRAFDLDGTTWNSVTVPADFGTLASIQNIGTINRGSYSILLSIETGTASVPEPMTLGLLGAGLAGLGVAARRRRRA